MPPSDKPIGKPLAGRRVVVTRAEHQAEQLALPLRQLGAEVALLPCLEVQPVLDDSRLRDAIAHLDTYNWLVVTSVNGADALGREAQRQGVSLQRMNLDVAAVGTGTAERLEVFGAPARHIPDAFTSFDLGKRIAQDANRSRVLLVQGTEAPNDLAQTLAAAGAAVERVDAYRMGIPHALRKRIKLLLREQKCPDAVTFTSPQIAKNFFDALAACDLSLPEATTFAAIGPVTAQAMTQMGHAPHVVARESRMAALATALGDFFRDRA